MAEQKSGAKKAMQDLKSMVQGDTEKMLDHYYKGSFAYKSGYLPSNRAVIDAWQEECMKEIEKEKQDGNVKQWDPVIQDMSKLIGRDGVVRMYVTRMLKEVPPKHQKITSIEDLLHQLNHIIDRAPLYEKDPAKRNFFPISATFVYMMMTPSGEAAFRNESFNDAILKVLHRWCQYLDGPLSRDVLNRGPNGWLSPAAYKEFKLDEYIIPDPKREDGGFKSYNAWFHRQIKPEVRPIAGEGDPSIITAANDGTVFKIARDVKRFDQFWIKGQPYSLENMLDGREFVADFIGGDVFQSFLSGADYHRFHAPVSGTIRYVDVVKGLTYSNTESAGFDPTAGTYSQSYGSSVNVRGICVIDADDPVIGRVVVLPVGITEISSITFTVPKDACVVKGAQLGYFSYGGSSLCLIFQPGAVKEFLFDAPSPDAKDPDDGPNVKVNAAVAISNSQGGSKNRMVAKDWRSMKPGDVEKYLDACYKRLPAYLGGYLPRERKRVDEMMGEMMDGIRKRRKEGKAKEWQPSIKALYDLIDVSGTVRMYLELCIEETPPKHRTFNSAQEMLDALNEIITTAPRWDPNNDFDAAYPMSALYSYSMMTLAGNALFRDTDYNEGLLNVLREWGELLNSKKSLYVVNRKDGWISPSAWKPNRLDRYIVDEKEPHGGFSSYNAYFYRQIKPDVLPKIDPSDSIITAPNEGTVYALQRNVKRLDQFWIKAQPYSLENMLDGAPYTDQFVGGEVYQSFLNLADYHRFLAPVDGVVLEAKLVKTGLTFTSTLFVGNPLTPDNTAGTYSQGYMSSMNQRAIIAIQATNPKIGLIVVIPIGSTDISSVLVWVNEGDKVEKGKTEIGAFAYGGSTLCMCVRPGVVKEFFVKAPDPNRKDPDSGPRVEARQKWARV